MHRPLVASQCAAYTRKPDKQVQPRSGRPLERTLCRIISHLRELIHLLSITPEASSIISIISIIINAHIRFPSGHIVPISLTRAHLHARTGIF